MFNRVRRYSLRDKDSVRRLCLDNCDSELRDEKALASVLCLYCDYYLDNEYESCFVAVDERDEVIGYLLCAPDFEKYKTVFGDVYVRAAEEYGAKAFVEAKMNMIPYSMFSAEYPAHIHMDVAKAYQREGIGTRLLSSAKIDLAKNGVKGIMLVCGNDNETGKSFYEKSGMKKLMTLPVGTVYATELKNE